MWLIAHVLIEMYMPIGILISVIKRRHKLISEVAKIREQIALEYQSLQFVFTGFSETAKHEFITQRQERIACCFEELQKHVTPEEAMQILIEESNQHS
jgi:hypothetical protein